MKAFIGKRVGKDVISKRNGLFQARSPSLSWGEEERLLSCGLLHLPSAAWREPM